MSRVLSIEDDHQLQFLVGTALYRAGYDVHYAFNGQEGFEKVMALDPDLILLDLMIPVMNGIELLKKLKANKATQDIPIIIVTAHGDYATETNLLEHSVRALGAVEYLKKPVRLQDLLSTVKNVLEKYPRVRNAKTKKAAGGGASEVKKGAVRIDARSRAIWVNDRLVATLAPRRFDLLRHLIEANGPVTKEELLKDLSYGGNQINALEKTLQRLREDLGDEGHRIKTTSLGYEFKT